MLPMRQCKTVPKAVAANWIGFFKKVKRRVGTETFIPGKYGKQLP